MKAYFIQLFNYDRYANQLISDTIIKAGSPGKSVQLMAHLLMAQQVWLNRCKSLPPPNGVLWPDWDANRFEQLIKANHRAWINFLDYSNFDDFDKIIKYKTLKGDSYESKLSDILTHIINHGTHHRAQAGQHLKSAVIDLPITDYIFYIREH